MKTATLAAAGIALVCAAAAAEQSGSQQPTPTKTESATTMKGFVDNIEHLTEENSKFRHVLYTGKYAQLVLMALKPGEDIGEEIHADTDQFFRIEKGTGEVRINGVSKKITAGDAVVVPAGARHNVVNTSGTEPLQLYTLYAPPHHRDGTVEATKAEAEKSTEHFEGTTSE